MPSIFEYLLDGYELGIEDSANPTIVIMLLPDMIAKCPMVKFLHKMDFCHISGSITVKMRYTFWYRTVYPASCRS